jgi:hypothetical protein
LYFERAAPRANFSGESAVFQCPDPRQPRQPGVAQHLQLNLQEPRPTDLTSRDVSDDVTDTARTGVGRDKRVIRCNSAPLKRNKRYEPLSQESDDDSRRRGQFRGTAADQVR